MSVCLLCNVYVCMYQVAFDWMNGTRARANTKHHFHSPVYLTLVAMMMAVVVVAIRCICRCECMIYACDSTCSKAYVIRDVDLTLLRTHTHLCLWFSSNQRYWLPVTAHTHTHTHTCTSYIASLMCTLYGFGSSGTKFAGCNDTIRWRWRCSGNVNGKKKFGNCSFFGADRKSNQQSDHVTRKNSEWEREREHIHMRQTDTNISIGVLSRSLFVTFAVWHRKYTNTTYAYTLLQTRRVLQTNGFIID